MIDARLPLLYAVKTWLQQYENSESTSGASKYSNFRRQRKRVVLETPDPFCYKSIQKVLSAEGYDVVELEDVKLHRGTPILIYERTTQDTIHTIRRLVQQNVVEPKDVCALCPTHHGLVEQGNGDARAPSKSMGVSAICTSEVYDQLFRFVRALAKEGYSASHIQKSLDEGGNQVPLQRLHLAFPNLS